MVYLGGRSKSIVYDLTGRRATAVDARIVSSSVTNVIWKSGAGGEEWSEPKWDLLVMWDLIIQLHSALIDTHQAIFSPEQMAKPKPGKREQY